MRFTVVTSGGEGDTRPVAALCRGLIDAGHEVRLFLEESTAHSARTLEVPIRLLAGDLQAAMPMNDPLSELKFADFMAVGKNVQSVVERNAVARTRSVLQHAQASDVVLVTSFALCLGSMVAQEVGKPVLGIGFQPITPTREFPTPMMPPMRLPGWLNRASYKLTHAYLRRGLGRTANAVRKEVFSGATAKRGIMLDFPFLYGVSPSLISQPQDWSPGHMLCGQFCAPDTGWQPRADLLDFLDAGPPPIYAGFGSSASFVRGRALSALIDAVAGRRAIFSPGWSRIDASMLPSNFFVIGDVPHDWLFPRTSLVIHHGGSGTTHSAARAGVPSVVLPVGGDQFFWAHVAATAGVAAPKIKGARTDAAAIARMIEFAQRADVRERARKLGLAMSQERGVQTAVKAIQALVGRYRC